MSAADCPHILVIEDEPAVRALLELQLKAKGYRVTVAGDGLEGLMKLERMRPDLVISDVMMPNLDGIEFVRAIKQHDGTREIPVIVLTARTDPTTLIAGINAGARFYVTKPFQMEELLSKVHRALCL